MIHKPVERVAQRCAAALSLGLLLCWSARTCADETPTESKLQYYSLPSAKPERVRELVIEPGGVVWAMGNHGAYVLEADKFRESDDPKLQAGLYLTGLWGGPDRGVYATQPGAEEHQGRLFRLSDGKAEDFTTYYFDNSTDRPGIYVAKSGQLFNWGERFLATLVDKEWKRIEGRFGPRPGMIRPAIFDHGDSVDFYVPSTNTLYRANKAGDLRKESGPAWLDATAKPGPRVATAQTARTQAVALWGENRVLLTRNVPPVVAAFDLKSLEQVDVSEVNKQLDKLRLFDAFRMQNGDVWLLSQVPGRKEYSVHRLSVDGQVKEVVKQLPWVNTRTFQFPRAVCEIENGDVLFGLEEDGLVVARDGQTMHWNWRHGLPRETPVFARAADGTVWFSNSDRLVRARVGNQLPVESAEVAEWDEYPLHSNEAFWDTAPGELAMIRADHPKQLARYSAKGWTMQDLPVETDRIQRSAVDDRGHLLLTFADKTPRYLDVGPDGVTEAQAFTELVEAAITAGARQIRAGRGSGSIVVVGPEQVWMTSDARGVARFDGERWDGISFKERVERIVPSAAYNALFYSAGKYYRYDRGQVTAPETNPAQPRAMMFGRTGSQPYDRALFERARGQYFPAVRSGTNWQLFVDADTFERRLAAGEPAPEPPPVEAIDDPFSEPPADAGAPNVPAPKVEKPPSGLTLPMYFERLVPAEGGAWLFLNDGAGQPARLWEGQLLPLDFRSTPLADKRIYEIVQDPTGDLWFLTKFNHTATAVRHKQSNRTLHLPKFPRECGRQLEFPIGVQPGQLASKIRYACRVDDGPWIVSREDGRTCIVKFEANGAHRCQVVGLLFGAPIGQTLSFDIDATDSIPDTKIEPPRK